MTLRCLGARRICRCTAAAFALQALFAARGMCTLRVQGQSGRGTGGLAWSGRAAYRRAHRRKRRALCPLRAVWIQADTRAQNGASALHRHQVSASLMASHSASLNASLNASLRAQLALCISSSAWIMGRRERTWTCERARGATNTMRPISNYCTSMTLIVLDDP